MTSRAARTVISAGTHAFLDRRWPVIELMKATGSAAFARPVVRLAGHIKADGEWSDEVPLPLHGPYLADQALHHVCLAVAALILAGGPEESR